MRSHSSWIVAWSACLLVACGGGDGDDGGSSSPSNPSNGADGMSGTPDAGVDGETPEDGGGDVPDDGGGMEGPDGSDGGGTTTAAGQFVQKRNALKAKFVCATGWTCPRLTLRAFKLSLQRARNFSSESACKQKLPDISFSDSDRSDLRQDVQAGRVDFDAQQAQRCLDAWQSWLDGDACRTYTQQISQLDGATLSVSPDACSGIFSGSGAEGAPCLSDEACQKGSSCYLTDELCLGECSEDSSDGNQKDFDPGDSCPQARRLCPNSDGTTLICAPSDSSSEGTCIEPFSRGTGQKCGSRGFGICKPALNCREGTCRESQLASKGDTCENRGCKPGLGCYQKEVGEPLKCRSIPGKGDDCSLNCKPGLYCAEDDTCKTKAGEGKTCETEDQCHDSGLACRPSLDGSGQKCVNPDVCIPKTPYEGDVRFQAFAEIGSLGSDGFHRATTTSDGTIHVGGTFYGDFTKTLNESNKLDIDYENKGGSGAFAIADDTPVDSDTVGNHAILDSESDEIGVGAAGDGNGNLYLAGTTDGDWGPNARAGAGDGNVAVNAGSGIIESTDDPTDAFVAKFDDEAKRQWVKVVGKNSDKLHRAAAVETDGQGNVYLVGHVQDSGRWSTFVAKWNGSGQRMWRKDLATSHDPDNDHQDIAVTDAGDVYVAAERRGSGSKRGPLPKVAGGDTSEPAFVAKLNSSGDVQWVGYTEDDSLEAGRGVGVALDSQGRVYLIGTLEDPDIDVDKRMFVARFDDSGQQQWLKSHDNVETNYVGGDWIGAVAVAPNNRAYIASGNGVGALERVGSEGEREQRLEFEGKDAYGFYGLAATDRGLFAIGTINPEDFEEREGSNGFVLLAQ